MLVIYLSFADGEFGIPALVGTGVAILLGPMSFYLGRRALLQRTEKNEPRATDRKLRAD